MPSDYPLGITSFELRELAGHPHAWEEMDDILVIEQRLHEYPDWVVRCRLCFVRGSPVLVGLMLEPASNYPWPPAKPLETDVIRSVSTNVLKGRARMVLSAGQQIGIGIQAEAAEFHRNRHPGKRGRPDVFYVRLIVRYLDLVESSNSPTRDLSEELGVSPSQARDLISEARRRKLLTKSERGVAGGELTEKALRLLAAHGEGGIESQTDATTPRRAPQKATAKTSKPRSRRNGESE